MWLTRKKNTTMDHTSATIIYRSILSLQVLVVFDPVIDILPLDHGNKTFQIRSFLYLEGKS
jgi:hypothetical protein